MCAKNKTIYNLSGTKPLASGFEKLVFQHPESGNLLIKVWQPGFFDRKNQRHPISAKLNRLPKYNSLLNEFVEQLVVYEHEHPPHFIQSFKGLVDTDLGLGITVQAVRKKNGQLAETLRQIIENGNYSQPHQKAVEELFEWLKSSNLIIRDFRTKNLVWDEENEHFVIIDGIGGKVTFSFRRLISSYNAYSNRKQIRTLRKRINEELKRQQQI